MNKKDNGEEAFTLMCKTGIILIITIIIIGIIAVILNFVVKGNAEWYIPVKVINGGEE